MRHQIKLILISCLLFTSIGINGQDSIFYHTDVRIDSLHKLMNQEMEQKLLGLKVQFSNQITSYNIVLDSLFLELNIQKEEDKALKRENVQLVRKLAEVKQLVLSNKEMMDEEHRKFRKVLFISGPSILGLLIVCTVLFYLLMIKFKGQTEQKISALRKYTHSEIEESKNDLLNKLKKRLKKISKGKKVKSKKDPSKGSGTKAKNK